MVLRADLTVIVEASGDDDGDETYVATVLYAPSSTSEWALAPLWTPNATLALDSDGLLVAPITRLPASYLKPDNSAGLSWNLRCQAFCFSWHFSFELKVAKRFLHSWTFLSALVWTI